MLRLRHAFLSLEGLFMLPCVFTEEASLCLEAVLVHYKASSSLMFHSGK